MTKEFIKMERTIYKRSYGLEWKDRLVKISGEELGGNELSPEFKDQLWEDMSIDIEELIEEFGDKEDIAKLVQKEERNNESEMKKKIDDIEARLKDSNAKRLEAEEEIKTLKERMTKINKIASI